VAVDRDWPNKETGEKETDFIDCVAWRHTGEFVSKWFTKGSMIVVSGRLQIRSWVDKDGNKRKTAEIVADNVYFGESKKKENTGPITTPTSTTTSFSTPNNYGGYGSYNAYILGEWGDDDEQLPF
jgi:single-strand DNA-binding protein